MCDGCCCYDCVLGGTQPTRFETILVGEENGRTKDGPSKPRKVSSIPTTTYDPGWAASLPNTETTRPNPC